MTHPIGTPYDSMGARMRKDVSESDVVRVARALCRHESEVCQTDEHDAWNHYAHEYKAQARIAIAALAACTPAKSEGR